MGTAFSQRREPTDLGYKSMLFGPVGRQVEIPWPQSGMGVENALFTETTDLLSGEQAVYRAPVTYKTYNMSWKGGATKLQPLLDVHSGVYGRGPYYITDPLAGEQGANLLPSKWAAPHQLSHIVNGWCSPVVSKQLNTPERLQVTFTGNPDDSDYSPTNIVVPVVPKLPLYFKAWGSRTGGAVVAVSKYTASTDTWSNFVGYTPTLSHDVPATLVSQAEADAGDVQAVKLTLFVGGFDTLTLQHIDLATNDYRYYTPLEFGLDPSVYPSTTLYPGMTLYPSGPDPSVMFRSGRGTGPVQFTGNVGGSIDSVTIDRIGLSMDIREVSRDPNN
jgi:hypothetical protein